MATGTTEEKPTPPTLQMTTPVNSTLSYPDGSSISVYIPNVTSDPKVALKNLLQSAVTSL